MLANKIRRRNFANSRGGRRCNQEPNFSLSASNFGSLLCRDASSGTDAKEFKFIRRISEKNVQLQIQRKEETVSGGSQES